MRSNSVKDKVSGIFFNVTSNIIIIRNNDSNPIYDRVPAELSSYTMNLWEGVGWVERGQRWVPLPPAAGQPGHCWRVSRPGREADTHTISTGLAGAREARPPPAL